MKIKIARISSTHGLKGDVKVLLIYLDMVETFEQNKTFIINDKECKVIIKSKGKQYICSIEGVNSIEEAQKILGSFLEIEVEMEGDMPLNGEGLLGFNVFFENNHYGLVKDWGNYGSGEVIEILNQSSNQIEIYLLDSDWIKQIDEKNKKIIMNKIY
jgi:ribosomal 30S subunit maturation factor RimM